jgi:hypothetical protein
MTPTPFQAGSALAEIRALHDLQLLAIRLIVAPSPTPFLTAARSGD